MCWLDSTFVSPPSGIVTAEIVHAVYQHGNVGHSMLMPSIVKDLALRPDTLAALGSLSGITFAGGPLDQEATRLVASVIKLSSTLGATEYGSVSLSSRPKALANINYFRFSEDLGGNEFREVQGQSGLFELVMVRDASIELMQPIFVTFSHMQEYRTKYCFSRHPSENRLWKYESRLDDILVLSNGEELNVVPMEGILSRCSGVRGCLVVGQGHFQTALLVEAASEGGDLASHLVSLRPYIEEANQITSRYGRIDPDFIMLTSGDRPLARTGKGTVQ
jgi:acyl-coenzyme A synthetase/AMP-(fatty) acid ligase